MRLNKSLCSAFHRLMAVSGMLAALSLFVFVGACGLRSPGTADFGVTKVLPASGIDLTSPDAIIRTNSLAKLPRDLLRVPLFRDVLTEDFVFYYEQNTGRLSLGGALRRIAYEHNLDLGDWVIRTVIDEPAEIAFWKGPNGRLKHYLIAMTRNNLAKLLEMAAKVVLNDSQLKRAGGDLMVQGENVSVFVLTYASNRTLLFATRGKRMVILSDAGMLKDRKGKMTDDSRNILSALLSKDVRAQRIYGDRFQVNGTASEHTVAVTARYLSFGYQHFFPAVQSLRFDFGKDGWSTQVMVDPGTLPAGSLNTAPLWNLVPMEPSICFALPVDWDTAGSLLPRLGMKKEEAKGLIRAINGPVGVCWYPKSRLHTPLFVVPISRALGPSETKFLAKAFEAAIGLKRPDLNGSAEGPYPATAVQNPDNSRLWQRLVPSRYGIHRPGEKGKGTRRDGRFFQVTLAQHARSLIFSPDERLVEDALAVAAKKFPALGDSLPKGGAIIAVITPSSLSALVQTETFASLPAAEEAVLRSAANAHLLPKLAALKRHPAYSLILPENVQPIPNQWVPVIWRPVGNL